MYEIYNTVTGEVMMRVKSIRAAMYTADIMTQASQYDRGHEFGVRFESQPIYAMGVLA